MLLHCIKVEILRISPFLFYALFLSPTAFSAAASHRPTLRRDGLFRRAGLGGDVRGGRSRNEIRLRRMKSTFGG